MTAAHPSDEERDVPLITIDLVYLTGVIIFALAVLLGVFAGSVLLHTFDAEIRHGLGQAWDLLQRLYWASLHAQG